MEILLESLQSEWDGLLRITPRLILALALLLLSILVGKGLSRVVDRVLFHARLETAHKSFFRRATVWLAGILGGIVGLNILGLKAAASGLLAGGGITAVVLGFAFREIGENFLAGILLAFRSPFRVDDLIESGDLKGTVRGIEIRHTHIRTVDGRDIFIPNSQIVNRPLVNYTRDGMLRPSFTVGIDYGDDAGEACRRLRRVAGEVPGVIAEPPVTVTIAGLEASWVQLEVAFWIDVFAPGIQLSAVRTTVIDACRRELRESGFTLSSDTSSTLALRAPEPIEVRVEDGGADHRNDGA